MGSPESDKLLGPIRSDERLQIGPIGRKTGEFEMDGIGALQIEEVIRLGLATELPFSSVQDGLDVEIGERNVRVAYSSFELSDAAGDLTSIKFHLRPDTGELWIGDLHVDESFRRQGVGRRLVQVAEIVATETRMDVVNLFPLRSSGSFWAKLGYTPHRFTARVLSKPCGCCSSVLCLEDAVPRK